MLRRKPLKRKASLKTRKPIPKQNVERRAKNFDRSYGDKAEWIRGRLCARCCHSQNIQAAHVSNGGMGRKADSDTLIPLCGPRENGSIGCHAVLHNIGIKSFEQRLGMTLKILAAAYESEYQFTQKKDAT